MDTGEWQQDASELEHRSQNVMWTVSSDYRSELSNDEKVSTTVNCALFYGIIAGGKRIFIDWSMLSAYLNWRSAVGFKRHILLMLSQLAIIPYICKRLSYDRPGVVDIQKSSAEEMLIALEEKNKLNTSETLEHKLFTLMAGKSIGDTHLDSVAYLINSCAKAQGTEELVHQIDEIYFVLTKTQRDSLLESACYLKTEEGCLATVEQEIDALSLKLFEKQCESLGETLQEQAEIIDTNGGKIEVFENLEEQISFFKGGLKIDLSEKKRLERKICLGKHKDFKLHITDGVLRSEGASETKIKYAKKDYEKNYGVFLENEAVIRQQIINLKEALIKTLNKAKQKDFVPSNTGFYNPLKSWRIGRTNCHNMFNKMESDNCGDFVVDVLIDSSSSQKGRETLIAIQAYILIKALTEAKIPCRMTGFNSFLHATVLKCFKDYDDGIKACDNIFEFYCEGSNRDGLAIKAVCERLYQRTEENKILIVLSDGLPNDVQLRDRDKGYNLRGENTYSGSAAVYDTAKEIRIARRQGVSVLGVFTGTERELDQEQRMYGKDFVYTRKVTAFSKIVIIYLKRMISNI